MSDVTIWRLYPDGSVKNETHVLWPHRVGRMEYTGFDGDVGAWSVYNQRWRPGCAQIVRRHGQPPEVAYQGDVSEEQTVAFIKANTK